MSVDLPMPRVGPVAEHAPKPIRVVLNWGRRYSLWVFNFGLACCAIEFIATSMGRHDFMRLGVIPFAPGPRQADLMVVSGTVTDKMAPAIRRLYDQMPEPKYVISFGACSNSGGPYWDSYSVTKGVDQLIPVDVYVPGCPPRPEALLQGIIRLQWVSPTSGSAVPAIAARQPGRLPAPQRVRRAPHGGGRRGDPRPRDQAVSDEAPHAEEPGRRPVPTPGHGADLMSTPSLFALAVVAFAVAARPVLRCRRDRLRAGRRWASPAGSPQPAGTVAILVFWGLLVAPKARRRLATGPRLGSDGPCSAWARRPASSPTGHPWWGGFVGIAGVAVVAAQVALPQVDADRGLTDVGGHDRSNSGVGKAAVQQHLASLRSARWRR